MLIVSVQLHDGFLIYITTHVNNDQVMYTEFSACPILTLCPPFTTYLPNITISLTAIIIN